MKTGVTRIEREPQLIIIAPVFENGSVPAYWGNVESVFHVFPVDDLVAISCDYNDAFHFSVAHKAAISIRNEQLDTAVTVTIEQMLDLIRRRDPALEFYQRQRKVVNLCSRFNDHTTYWSSLDDFVAHVVTRLLDVSRIPLYSLTNEWTTVSSERRQWRVRLLSGCRAVTAIAAFFVLLSKPLTAGATHWIVSYANLFRNYAGWLAEGSTIQKAISTSLPQQLLGSGLLLFGLYLVYAVARFGWRIWDRSEMAQFFKKAGYHVHVVGVMIFASAWITLIAFPPLDSRLLPTAVPNVPVSAFWISLALLVISAGVIWKAGMPAGSVQNWATDVMKVGEKLLAETDGDRITRLDDARFRLKMGATLLKGRRHLDNRIRALFGLARALELLDTSDLSEWDALVEQSVGTLKLLEKAHRESASVQELLQKARARRSQKRPA